MNSSTLALAGFSISPVNTPVPLIRERLAALPRFSRYADQVDAVLGILGAARPCIPETQASVLCNATFAHSDEIAQLIEGYSPSVLSDKVREVSGLPNVADFHAFAAFAIGSALGALVALGESLMGGQCDELEALGLYQAHLDAVAEWLPQAAVRLDAAERSICEKIGEMAAAASWQASSKANGFRSGMTRRGRDGIGPRDLAVMRKALELIRAGTRFHNLNSKLRAWQMRETGEALSKPAMGALLQRLGLSLSHDPVNRSVNRSSSPPKK